MNTVETLVSPFKHLVMTIGELPTTFVESMSYYEAMAWLVNYLEKTVIPTVNNNAAVTEETQKLFIELKEYVDNYFANLDVQEEIDNKLDDMAEAGTLTELITAYLQMKAVLGFDTVSDMASATNVTDGSFARTYGYSVKGDGGGASYFIRTKTEADTPNNTTMIAVGDDYVAILNEFIPTPEQFGCAGDGTTDDTDKLQALITYLESEHLPLYLTKSYGITSLSISSCHIIGRSGKLIEIDSSEAHNMIEADGDCKIEGVRFEGSTLSTCVRFNNTNAGGTCLIEDCYFTGNSAEYIAVTRPNSIIKNCIFDNRGYKTTHEVRFGTGSDGSIISGCTLYDASGFNIQTYNANNIRISNNEIHNKFYTITAVPASSTLTVTVNTADNETQLKRFGVLVDGVINTSASVTNNDNGSYTITFANAVTSSNTITFLGWKSLENVNVNGGCSNIMIDNNRFDVTGDSNIVVGNDYIGTLENPKYIQIIGNNLSNAHDAGIAIISRCDSCLVSNNEIRNCSLGCNNASYNLGVIANNLKNSTISNNLVVIDNTASQAVACVSCTNYSSNYYDKKPSEYTKLAGNSCNLTDVYLPGLGSESQEGIIVDTPSFAYPAMVDLDTAFTSGHPTDDEYFTFSASGGGASQDTTNMLVGSGCIKTGSSSSAFINIRPKLTSMFKKSLVTFRLMAKAETAGDSFSISTYQKNNAGTVLNGTLHELSPSASEWNEYQIQVRTASTLADDTSTRLRITGGTGHVFVDCISVSYQPLP